MNLMLEELESIETPDTSDFIDGFVDGIKVVAGVVAIYLGATAIAT